MIRPPGGLKLFDRFEVVVDCLPHWKPKTVAGLHLVIAPGQVFQPQALDGGKVRRQCGFAKSDTLCHE